MFSILNHMRIATVICLVWVMLVGCTAPPRSESLDENIIDSSSNSESFEEETRSMELSLLQNFDGDPLGGYGPTGLYFVTPWARADGSFNLLYADYKTQQSLYLCAQPNCPHDTPACTSFISASPGGVLPEVIGTQLALFHLGDSFGYSSSDAVTPAYIEVMDFDGQNRRSAVSFAANQRVEKPMLTDGKAIYCRLSTFSEQKTTAELIRIDLTSGSYEILYTLNADLNERIWGGVGRSIILYRSSPIDESLSSGQAEEYQICLLDITTGETEILYQWSPSELSPSLFGNHLVYISRVDAHFHILNISTREEIVLTQYTIPPLESFTRLGIFDFSDEHLLFREITYASDSLLATDISYYTLKTDGTIPVKWGLTYPYAGDRLPVRRVATIDEEHYLVIESEFDSSEPAQNEDGTSYYIAASQRRYASISKQDYWAGVNNFSLYEFH